MHSLHSINRVHKHPAVIVIGASLLLGCWYLFSAPRCFQETIHYPRLGKVGGEAQHLAAKTATHPLLLPSSLAPGPSHVCLSTNIPSPPHHYVYIQLKNPQAVDQKKKTNPRADTQHLKTGAFVLGKHPVL